MSDESDASSFGQPPADMPDFLTPGVTPPPAGWAPPTGSPVHTEPAATPGRSRVVIGIGAVVGLGLLTVVGGWALADIPMARWVVLAVMLWASSRAYTVIVGQNEAPTRRWVLGVALGITTVVYWIALNTRQWWLFGSVYPPVQRLDFALGYAFGPDNALTLAGTGIVAGLVYTLVLTRWVLQPAQSRRF